MAREATIELETKGDRRTLYATLPGKITDREYAAFNKKLIEVIHGHTGCNCLSGVIPVVLHDEAMLEIIKVEL